MSTYETVHSAARKLADKTFKRDEVDDVRDHGLLFTVFVHQVCTLREIKALKGSIRRWAKKLGCTVRISQTRGRFGDVGTIYVRVIAV